MDAFTTERLDEETSTMDNGEPKLSGRTRFLILVALAVATDAPVIWGGIRLWHSLYG
jgi:hypothetical protein